MAFLLQFPPRPLPALEPRALGVAATLRRAARVARPETETRVLATVRTEEDLRSLDPQALRWVLATAYVLRSG